MSRVVVSRASSPSMALKSRPMSNVRGRVHRGRSVPRARPSSSNGLTRSSPGSSRPKSAPISSRPAFRRIQLSSDSSSSLIVLDNGVTLPPPMRLRFRPRLATIVEEEDGEDDDDEDDVDDGDVEDVDDAVPGTVEHMPEEGPVASSTPDALRFVLQRCPKGTRPALVKALTRASLVPGSDDALVDLLWSGSRLPLPSSAFDGAPDLLVNQFPGLQRVMSRRDFIHHRLRAVRHLLPFLPDVVFLPQPNAAMFAKGSWKLYPVHSRRRASVMTAKSLSKATSGVAVAERNDVVGQVQAWAVVTSIVPLRVYVYHGEAISVPSSWSSIHTVVASVICSIVTPDMHRDGSFQVVRVTVKIGRDGRLWLADVQSGVPIRGRPAAQVVTDVVRFVVSHQRRRQQDRNPLFHRADTPADLLSAMRRLTIQAPAVHS